MEGANVNDEKFWRAKGQKILQIVNVSGNNCQSSVHNQSMNTAI